MAEVNKRESKGNDGGSKEMGLASQRRDRVRKRITSYETKIGCRREVFQRGLEVHAYNNQRLQWLHMKMTVV